jgi:photosystem II stability/assembly factor-like uncharacterized protein
MLDLLAGTAAGVFQIRNGEIARHCLSDFRISAVHVSGSGGAQIFLAGTYGQGVFRSEDGGEHWSKATDGMDATAIRTLITDPFDASAILAGTKPGRIYRSRDGGAAWTELDDIANLPRADEWYLPYSPRAGAVRNIYAPPGTNQLLASVEVGGLLSSNDKGETWTVSPVLGDTDIHFVTGHPEDGNVLWAALGWASLKSVPVPDDAPPLGGVARSTDGGASWTKFHSDYTRAVIVPPSRPDLVLAAPAKKVGQVGRIEVSADNGQTWQPASEGIDTPMGDMVERFEPTPDGAILAICRGGSLYRADPGEWKWTPLLPSPKELRVESVAYLS